MNPHLHNISERNEHTFVSWTPSAHLSTLILRYAFLTGLMLFPTLRISNFPLPFILIFTPVLLMGKLPIPKLFFQACIVAGMFILFVTILNLFITNNLSLENYSLKDLHYFSIPIAYGIFTGIIVTLFGGSRGKQTLLRFLSFFLTIQFVFMLLQRFNPANFRAFTEPYLLMLGKHVSSGYIQNISNRPAGFAINPTWAGFLFYPMGRLLYTYTNKSRYLALSAGIIVMAAARMAMLVFALSELFLFFLELVPSFLRLRVSVSQIKRLFRTALLVGFVSLTTFLISPKWFQGYLKRITVTGLETVTKNYSYTHRMKMFKILCNNPDNWALGGWTRSDFSKKGMFSVDSELVMRTLQFGIPGFLAFHLPFYGMLLYSYRRGYRLMLKVMIVLVVVACLSSLTMTVASNPYFICMLSVLIGFCILDATERLASI